MLTFLSALASPWHRASFPVDSSRSTAARWLDHGEQRHHVHHSRWWGSSGARQALKRVRLGSPRVREAVGALGVAGDLTDVEIPAGLWPRKLGVADEWGRLTYGSRLSAPLRVWIQVHLVFWVSCRFKRFSTNWLKSYLIHILIYMAPKMMK